MTSALPTTPVVTYIAGSGRSGSTLLERALGAMPGFVNVGELIDLFRRVVQGDERCGCGLSFFECPFWTGVGKLAFGGWDTPPAVELARLQPKVARQRHLPRLLSPVRSAGFARDVRRYQHLYADLYRAILDQSDASVVVDASKWPAQALALRCDDIDLRVIHLVRDVRGVAYSMVKRDVARPHAAETGDVMTRSRPAATAVRWTVAQSEIDLMRLRQVPMSRLRYEDMVRDPRRAIDSALRGIGLDPEPGWFQHVHRSDIDLDASHGLSGNPSRFTNGVVSLRVDEAWRTSMSRSSRIMVASIAFPQLVATGSLRATAPHAPHAPTTKGTSMTATQPVATAPGPGHDDQWPLVSVVLPTRGRPELVRESIAAVVAQDYPGPVETLVIHDQEEPEAGLVALGSSGREVKVLTNQHSPGLAGARNTGLDVVKGEFVATCDDDDVWHPTKLSRQVRLMRDEPDLLVVGSGIRLLFPKGRVVDWPGRSQRIEQSTLLRNRVKELHSSTLLMRRDAFAKAGRYDEELPHGYAEDYDWVLRAARVGQIGVVVEPLADIRKDVQSWFRERSENTAEALTYMLVAHPELTTSRRGHARILGQIAYAQACLGERRTALRTAVRALGRYPFAPHAYLALWQAGTGLDPQLTLKAARIFRRGVS